MMKMDKGKKRKKNDDTVENDITMIRYIKCKFIGPQNIER